MPISTGKESATAGPGTGLGALRSREAAATIAVDDIKRAREFYEGVLGLTLVDTEGDQVAIYQTGKSQIMVYVSQFAGTNKATTITWGVGDELEGLVQALKDRGVTFEHYDMPETSRQGEIHAAGNTRVAWFKDPDGNIISLVNS